jgi:hypothetical protein
LDVAAIQKVAEKVRGIVPAKMGFASASDKSAGAAGTVLNFTLQARPVVAGEELEFLVIILRRVERNWARDLH